MNGPINSAAAGQSAIGSIDDRIDLLERDIAPNQLDRQFANSATMRVGQTFLSAVLRGGQECLPSTYRNGFGAKQNTGISSDKTPMTIRSQPNGTESSRVGG